MAHITARLTTGMAVRLSNGRHEWNADEPINSGGTDSGPNPYELLLGSLAACTCVTIAWYCQFKKLPLESVSTTYDFDRVHVDDCKDCDIPDRGFIERITSNVHVQGNFDDGHHHTHSSHSSDNPSQLRLAHNATWHCLMGCGFG